MLENSVSLSSLSNLNNNVLNSISMNNRKLNHSKLNNNSKLNHSKLNHTNHKLNKKVKKERIYELVDFPKQGDSYGVYKGSTPKQAAKKAFSKLARLSHLNNSNQKFIVFVIREKVSNKNGVKREFKYMGQRVKLERNIEIKRGNKTVTIKYKNIVNKFKNI